MPVKPPTIEDDIRNSMIGLVTEIARFTIYDYRHHKQKIAKSRADRAKEANDQAQAGAGQGLGGGGAVALPPGQELGAINGNLGKDEKKFGARMLTFKVQFNPSELSLNTSALDINKQSVLLHAEKLDAVVDSATANLNVNLIFDKMNALDAFMMDNGGLSLNGIGNAIGGLGAAFSVKPEVETLLAAIRDENTRQAEFRWNDFVFDGYLQYVQVRYTMFSPVGHPVRAVVAIRMKREATTQDEWVQDFDEAFSGAGGQLGSRTQNGGLVNL